MRRLALASLAAVLFFGYQVARPALAVNYAAGWNLVAGPEGSHLTGATGNIFTLQPGDADYEVFPASAALHGGYGYWAYFPSGGGITFAAGATSLSVTPVPGQYMMLGNPSQSVASIIGADQVLTYSPGNGYQRATALAPGQGAWVTSTGQIALTAAADSAPVTSVPTPQQPAAPTTLKALRAVALQAGDLPGYTFQSETLTDPPLIGFFHFWFNENAQNSRYGVIDYLRIAPSVAAASSYLTTSEESARSDVQNTNLRSLGSQGVGDESTSFSYNYRLASGTLLDDFVVSFRRGTTVVTIDRTDLAGRGSIALAVQLARIIDSRLTDPNASVPALMEAVETSR